MATDPTTSGGRGAGALDEARSAAKRGDFAGAATAARAVLERERRNVEAYRILAFALRRQGRHDDVVGLLSPSVDALPPDPQLRGELAMALHALGRVREAVPQYERAVGLSPGSAAGHFHLGRAHLDLFDPRRAIAAMTRALQLAPGTPEFEAGLGHALASAGRSDEALAHLDRALAGRPDWAEVHGARARVLFALGRYEEAVTASERALSLRPGIPQALAARVESLEILERYDEAEAAARSAIEAGVLTAEVAGPVARVAQRTGRVQEGIALLEGALARPGLSAAQRSVALLQLGALREAAGRFDDAFRAYEEGKSLMQTGFDPRSLVASTDEVLDAFAPGVMPTLPRATVRTGLPVFVLGMPRSGTTLVEQILSCHPDVHAAGELSTLSDFAAHLHEQEGWRERYPLDLARLTPALLDRLVEAYFGPHRAALAGKRRMTDKMPHNFAHLGLIALLFPDARVIHCTRDPMDTCFSCFATHLNVGQRFTTRLEDIGVFYRQYRRLMDHWRSVLDLPVLEVPYERVTADVDGWARRIVEFTGLPWDERCARPHESARVVLTASRTQVRQPVYRTAVARWRRFERHLAPLREALAPFLDDGAGARA